MKTAYNFTSVLLVMLLIITCNTRTRKFSDEFRNAQWVVDSLKSTYEYQERQADQIKDSLIKYQKTNPAKFDLFLDKGRDLEIQWSNTKAQLVIIKRILKP